MAAPKYYYNARTLRYERARPSIKNILFTITGVLLTGSLIFVGLLFLQNRIITTPTEKELRAENKALKEHLDVLSARISSSKIKLATLAQKEEDLTKKFFDVRTPDQVQHASTDLLLQDEEHFDQEVKNLDLHFAMI